MTAPHQHVYCAIDAHETEAAIGLVSRLKGRVGGIKLGLEFFCAQGPAGVRAVQEAAQLPLFLDLKFHDIPNTVAGAVRSAASLAPAFMTIHASGGRAMMRAAVEAAVEAASDMAAKLNVPRARILGVTVLTSLDGADLADVGQGSHMADQVKRLATLAQEAGLDGVVCSPAEVSMLRAMCGPDFVLMVPGIRPAWGMAGDQKRVLTPREALQQGASYLVIGRPITQADDPAQAAERIAAELAEAA